MAGVVGAMAGEVGAAVLQALVQNLIDLTKNLISPMYDLDGEAQNLIKNLLTIQKFLNDAETRTIPSGDVKIWLNRLENAAFEADDVLDELHYHAAFPSIDNARNRNMAVSIKEINKDLKSINKMATALGLQKILADAPTVSYAGMETDAFSADPIFIGRDEVVAKIVETLISSVATHDERVFSILPIAGMGGLGKTTLTRKVFHHQMMKTQFRSHRIWVHVSQVFDPINLFKKILLELTSSQSGDGEISRQVILKRLQEALKDKKYFLVLDDLWNEDASKWEDFLNSLLGVTTTKGNGIIVTTRNTEVAKIVRPIRIHQLKGLSEEDCWSIIRAKSYGNDGVPSDVESVGREIAKRCGGLPLAASVLGGVLRRDKSVDEWRSISQNWLSSEGEGDNNITKILRLSFNNLSSPSLKKCFSYCSIFPKGERLERQKLIEMWMGEGFLGSNEDMESVGDKFYNVLLHSSLLQVYYDWCVMHDLVHVLASSVLGNADGVSRVRYLFHKQGISSPIKKEVAQHLRTLIYEADQPFDDNIFSDFKCLHVLILKGLSFKELPRSITKLIHLRNLTISRTWISDLPDWIGELHHLQTLRAPDIEKLPSTIKYLINLRHLHVHDEVEVELPTEIGRLTSLQTLPGVFSVRDKNGYKIEELGSLNNLEGSLTIRGLKKGSWVGLNQLVEIRFDGCRECEEIPMLGHLPNLKSLYLGGLSSVKSMSSSFYGIGYEPGIVFPTLETLELSNMDSLKEWAEVESGRTSEVEVFPHLQYLKISKCNQLMKVPINHFSSRLKSLEISGCNQLTTDSYLPLLSKLTSLRSLVLEGLESLPDELFYNNPNLSVLKISKCPKLREIPDGLQTLNSLKELSIVECHRLMDFPYQMVESFMATSVDQVWHFPKLWKLEIDVEGSRETSVTTGDRILQGCNSNSLRWLSLMGVNSCECLPESIQHLTSLEWLALYNFEMEELPKWFDQYISMQDSIITNSSRFYLNLFECKRLRRLPSTPAMRHLIKQNKVYIQGCPELQQQSDDGSE